MVLGIPVFGVRLRVTAGGVDSRLKHQVLEI
jgi:hypothetical protein